MSVSKALPALSGGRLAFERAIRRSSLPAPARHVALTIATWADITSGVIPERFQPSLSTIAEATGMGATTVKRHLGVLESEGWLVRDRPEIARARRDHARTQYALNVPLAPVEHGPERAMPRSGEDRAMGQSGPRHGPERAKAWSAAVHKSSLSTDESPGSTTSSPADASTDASAAPEVAVTEGGGGGSSLSRSTAEEVAAALDYRGKSPDRRLRQTITDRLTAALEVGWTLDGLALYLDLGDAAVGSPAAVYAHRLKPGVIPDPEPVEHQPRSHAGVWADLPTADEINALTIEDVLGTGRPNAGSAWEQATARARSRLATGPVRGGADDRVAGWAALSRQLAGPGRQMSHRPYSNEAWNTPATAAELARIAHCGDLECDPVTRLRDVDQGNGLKASTWCEKCHPKMQW